MKKLDLQDIVAIGRTFDEYYRFFDLKTAAIESQSILDAGGGVSSFTAEASEKGIKSVSADRIYRFSREELEQKAGQDLETMLKAFNGCGENYNWDFYKDTAGLSGFRKAAYKRFLEDYRTGRGKRYEAAEFPFTHFMDKEFSLTLVSHFLFLYDEHLDYGFHRNTIEELIRVTKGEVRIYPLVNLRWEKSGFVDMFLKDPVFSRCDKRIMKVDFEFVKGADEMLVISA